MVGVVWLSQPSTDLTDMKNINVLNVKGLNNTGYFAPSQNNIAEGTYPLARDLYIINCQGYSGLGMGFLRLWEILARIILKSGLLLYGCQAEILLSKVMSMIRQNNECEYE
jgi:phosphate transport system substrate-binding protein